MAKILIIDDDEAVRTRLRLTLAHFGHTAIAAGDGHEGLKLFRHHRPDLVITDIVMPEKEGLAVVLELRQMQPKPKIIAVSGGGRRDAEEYLRLAGLLGADRVLTKPFSTDVLVAAVAELLPEAGVPGVNPPA
jgi:DNA-binding response OmpR family regulator